MTSLSCSFLLQLGQLAHSPAKLLGCAKLSGKKCPYNLLDQLDSNDLRADTKDVDIIVLDALVG
jgi:hypothetical protein